MMKEAEKEEKSEIHKVRMRASRGLGIRVCLIHSAQFSRQTLADSLRAECSDATMVRFPFFPKHQRSRTILSAPF